MPLLDSAIELEDAKNGVLKWFKDHEPNAYAHYKQWKDEKAECFDESVNWFMEMGGSFENFPDYAEGEMDRIYGKYC